MRRGRLSVVGPAPRLHPRPPDLRRRDRDARPRLRRRDQGQRRHRADRRHGPGQPAGFALTSDPSLPQDEVLSRLLFKKASGGLSPFQALQLAQAVAQFSGGAGGVDVFEQARKGLGLDSLDVSTGRQRRTGARRLALSQRPPQRRREGGRQARRHGGDHRLRRDAAGSRSRARPAATAAPRSASARSGNIDATRWWSTGPQPPRSGHEKRGLSAPFLLNHDEGFRSPAGMDQYPYPRRSRRPPRSSSL